MNRWNAAAMVTRANRPRSASAATSRPSPPPPGSTRSASTTSSAARRRRAAATSSTSRATPPPASTPAPSSTAGSRADSSTTSARRSAASGLSSYPHPRRLPALGVPDRLDGPRPALRDLPGALQPLPARTAASRTPATCASGRSSATARWTSPSRSARIALAAREGLDNLTFVINCNLQRLDGPVRANFKIVQELEAHFRGAGWNVIKVAVGPRLGRAVRARPRRRARPTPARVPDAQFQTYADRRRRLHPRALLRRRPAAARAGPHLPDEKIERLRRAAVTSSARCTRPTSAAVDAQGRADRHPRADRQGLHARRGLDGSHDGQPPDEEAGRDESQGHARPARTADPRRGDRRRLASCRRTATRAPTPPRSATSGAPCRPRRPRPRAAGSPRSPLALPDDKPFAGLRQGLRQAGDRHHDGLRPAGQGPDARQGDRAALGADRPRRGPHLRHGVALPVAGIYSPLGQTYEPVDRDQLMYYKEAKDGQILNEGITEAGSMASFIAGRRRTRRTASR